ncbi:MAG: hypothetical protein R3B82_11660 [Sandaracinaceae bacterium]
MSRSAATRGSLLHLERGLEILVGAGFAPLDALRIFQGIYALVVGHCAFHYGPGEDAPIPEDALDPEAMPILVSLDLTDYDPDAELEVTLEAMLRALRP